MDNEFVVLMKMVVHMRYLTYKLLRSDEMISPGAAKRNPGMSRPAEVSCWICKSHHVLDSLDTIKNALTE